ncbi:MAG: hypothetical protein GEV08_07840 [Acidimicrobiia bacterium]|nr:hypothetical protein [Acidimicrobiia bacterium]
MPTISTPRPAPAGDRTAGPVDAVLRAALLGSRDLLEAALERAAQHDRVGDERAVAARVALGAVEAALGENAAAGPRLGLVQGRGLDRPVGLRAEIRLVD